ncbi:MAG: thioredoxin domain-containing protein [Aeromicrobium sp.]|uniref:DsbA family protein n=1 Tax=Aeromicrobium sp. TaxID=1871063 RepID=UPI0039E5BA7F
MSKDRQQRAARAEQMRKEREKAAKRQRNLITAAIVVIVVVLVGLAAYGIHSMNKKNQPQEWSVAYTVEDAGGEATVGYEPVVVEIYEDFQCPMCAQLETAYGADLKQMVASGDITIEYHPFSFLDDMGGSPNDYSKRATNAAICVYEEHGAQAYVDFHDYLFTTQPTEGEPGPENDALAEAAESMGFTGVEDCVKDEKYFQRIRRAKDAGSERGVSGTPTTYIDGEQFEATEGGPTLIAAIQAAVAERKGEPAPETSAPATSAPTATTPAS